MIKRGGGFNMGENKTNIMALEMDEDSFFHQRLKVFGCEFGDVFAIINLPCLEL